MQVKFTVRNHEQVQAFLKELPRGTLKTGLKALTEYLLGDSRHGLRHYEPYKYVKPFRSYSPDPAKAARQRAWIFANLDKIGKNNRTGATSNAWVMNEKNGGYAYTLTNSAKGAQHIWGDKTRTRHQTAVGHRTVSEKVDSNLKGAIRHALAEIKKWIAEKKPKG